jgi:outer membrane protein assembly factor BamB
MKLQRTIRLYLVAAILVGGLAYRSGTLYASDWPNWRGPDYNGISKETGWDAGKVNSNTKPLWKASVGTGFSSIAVSGGRAYTMGNTNNEDTVYCLDAATGSVIWKHSYSAPLDSDNYEGGPSATPTIADGKVYTISKKGRVFCLDADTGDVIWQKELNVKIPQWGLSGSALVIDNMVIFNAGTCGMALNKIDGGEIWQNGKGNAGYATGVPFTSDGNKCVAIFGADEASGLIAATGKEIWSFEWKTSYDINAADPIISGNKVFVSSGYNTGCGVFNIENGKANEVWRNKNIRNHFNSCVLLAGHIYGFDEKTLKCLDMATGREKWSKEGLGKGSLMAADGKLIILSEKGKLVIAEAAPTGFKEISSAQILAGKCWTVPVLANGRIYARNAVGDLVCVDVAGSTKPKAKTAGAIGSNDWPNWRGPNHDGISTETGWIAGKIKEGVKPLWETGIGTAFSSMTVSNGRLYTMGNTGESEMVAEEDGDDDEGDDEGEDESEEEDGGDEEEEQYYNRDYDAEAVAKGQSDIVYCLDAETGREIWKYSYPALLEGTDYQGGPNATPTVDGEKVYTLSKRGKVFCFNANGGKVIWQKDLRREFGIKTPYWGLASSPVIIDDMVIYNAGSYGIALDKNDGGLIWQNGKGPAGYASALPFSIGNQKCIAMLVYRELVGLAAATGKELWRVKWKTLYDENIPDVIISGDKLFASTGLGTGSALFKFDDKSLTRVWGSKKLQNHINSSVLWQGYIYGIDGGGLVCLDFETGRVTWEQKGDAKYGSSLTLSDGKLIILTEKGKLIIAEASHKGYKEITSAQILSGRCWTVPVLANGKIYARSNATGRLVCLDVSGG